MRAFWADLWQRRWFRWTFTPMAAIAVTWCCICLILNYAGEKRWQKVKARLEAEGETFDYFSLLPPPIPDEENFCAIEPLNGIRASESPGPAGAKGRLKRDEIERQVAFLNRDMLRVSFFDALYNAQPPDDEAIRQEFKRMRLLSLTLRRLPLPTSEKDLTFTWDKIKAELESHAPLLIELSKAATQRQEADYLPRVTREELPEQLLTQSFKHMSVCMDLGHLFHLYSVACMKVGDKRASLDAALVHLRLAKAARSQCSVGGGVNIYVHQTRFLSLVWLQLLERQLDDADLAGIQHELQLYDLTAQHLACVRGELVMMMNNLDFLKTHRFERFKEMNNILYGAPPSLVNDAMVAMSVILPDGFFTLNKASGVELRYDYLLEPIKKNGLRHLPADIASLQALLSTASGWERPDLMLSKWLEISGALHCVMALAENQRLQAILGCALERHYLRHHSYPARLEDLDPEFRTGVSLLDVNGDPMLYALSSDSRFRLWSPGPDGRDDGGKFDQELPARGRRSPGDPDFIGDWVWRYEPGPRKP